MSTVRPAASSAPAAAAATPARPEAPKPTVKPAPAADSFNRKPVAHDASAAAALKQLDVHGGPTISARELARAIDVGTRDHDHQAAGAEFAEFQRWAKQNSSKLTAGAKQVMAQYSKNARTAQAHHQTGMSESMHASMIKHMLSVKEPAPAPAPAPTPAPTPAPAPAQGTAKELQQQALAHPNKDFMRQVYSPTYNPHGPARSGNCAVTSLAMAAKAYGALTKPSDPQKFIEKVGKLTGDTLVGHNFQGTRSDQIRTGARALHMHGLHIPANGLDAALAKGHMVVLTGTPGAIYRAPIVKANGTGQYGCPTDTLHSILVMGKDSKGNYVVADPLARHGVVHLTSRQMRDFTARWTDGGTEVWKGA